MGVVVPRVLAHVPVIMGLNATVPPLTSVLLLPLKQAHSVQWSKMGMAGMEGAVGERVLAGALGGVSARIP